MYPRIAYVPQVEGEKQRHGRHCKRQGGPFDEVLKQRFVHLYVRIQNFVTHVKIVRGVLVHRTSDM